MKRNDDNSGSPVGLNPFFSRMIECIESYVSQQGSRLFIKYTEDNGLLSHTRSQPFEDATGIITFGTSLDAGEIAALEKIEIPGIIIDNSCPGANVDTLSINNENGIRTSVDYLLKTGHRRIGYIKWNGTPLRNFSERYMAYLSAVRENGLEPSDVIEVSGGMTEAAAQIEDALEKRRPEATAFIADNDYIAAATIRALREKGYRLPEDISIIGFDNDRLCDIIEPALTTNHVPIEDFCRLAVDLLMYRIRNPSVSRIHARVNTGLVIRESACRRPGNNSNSN